MKVLPISKKKFINIYKVKSKSPFKTKLFNSDDFKELQTQSGIVSADKKALELMKLIPDFFLNPVRIFKNLPVLLRSYLSRVIVYYKSKKTSIYDTYPFTDYSLKANIVASFNPNTILEIGTAHGWAIVCFKALLPRTKCFTIDNDTSSESGKLIRRKNIDIKQYWGDSEKFDYSIFPKIDVTYIDGNHKYKSVSQDLVNCSKFTKKMIILDDYLPSQVAPRGDIFQYLWFHAEVTKAVGDFLKNYPSTFKKAYWIKDTAICVLVK